MVGRCGDCHGSRPLCASRGREGAARESISAATLEPGPSGDFFPIAHLRPMDRRVRRARLASIAMSLARERRAVVVGAGPAGIAAALALRRAGIEPLVLERSRALGEVGSALTLWPNAIAALEALGASEAVRAASAQCDGIALRTDTGEVLDATSGAEMKGSFGSSGYALTRAELLAALEGELGAEAVRLEARCTGFREDADGLVAVTSIMCTLGDRLGLFKELARNGPATSHELAERAGIDARYAREWLSALASAGYLEYDPETERFVLPEEHVMALAAEGSPMFMGGAFQQLPGLFGPLDELTRVFRNGGGIPAERYSHHLYSGMER